MPIGDPRTSKRQKHCGPARPQRRTRSFPGSAGLLLRNPVVGRNRAYSIEYAVRAEGGAIHWVEDSGRWFASSDGRPLRAHGAVRIITESYEMRRRLIEASEIDPLTGQLSRHRFCEVLEDALDEAC